MMKNIITIVALVIILPIYSQNFEWAVSVGGTLDDRATSIAVDDEGNSYTTGYFEGTSDFNPGSSNFNMTSNGDFDAYIVKLNSTGGFVWAKSFGGNLSETPTSITIDDNNNIYLIGQFYGTTDLDPSGNTHNITALGDEDIFIVKLDSDGDFIWGKSIGGVGDDRARSITVDSENNVYSTGAFFGPMNCDQGASDFILNSTNNSWDAFVLKLDEQGDFSYARAVGGSYSDMGTSLDVDQNGNVYLTGFFAVTADFDPSSNVINHSAVDFFDVFLLKLDINGDYLWSKTFGSIHDDESTGITIANDGFIYVTGYFQDTISFDNGGSNYTLESHGSFDAFVVKLNNQGEYQWEINVGGQYDDRGHSIITDAHNFVYIAGDYYIDADFDPSSAVHNVASAAGKDGFILKLNENGIFQWVTSVGGAITDDNTFDVEINSNDEIFSVGRYFESGDFDPTNDIFNLTANGQYDAYIQKLNDPFISLSELDQLDIKIFPNPSTNNFNLFFEKEMHQISISIYSLDGQLIFEKTVENAQTINLDFALKKGLYYLNINHEGSNYNYKIIKN